MRISCSKLMSGCHLDHQLELQELEAKGLFVVHTSDGDRPLRALARRRSHERYPRALQEATPPMHVRLLGSFQAHINGRPLAFVRRRDRQIFKYIALQPNGSASRTELIGVFWPRAEGYLAAQSLRTACSQIRRAIKLLVGCDGVDTYFRASEELSINLDNVIVDVNSFLRHADDGDEQYDRGDLRGAYAHYCRLARVYRRDLVAGEPRAPWAAAFDATLKVRHRKALARMTEIVAALDYHRAGA